MAASKMMSDFRRRVEQAQEDERSKAIVECIWELYEACKTLEADSHRLNSDRALMLRLMMNQESRYEQLQGQISEQDTNIASLEERVNHLANVSHESVLLIEITDYMQKKSAAMRGPPCIYSDDFYTDRYGYRMCAHIYLNGDCKGKGTYLSVYFIIKKGPNDSYLSWPFQRRVTFTLLNQDGKDHLSDAFRPDPVSLSFQKPISEMNIASGFPMFVPHAVIENPNEGFLRNDTIAIRVEVAPS